MKKKALFILIITIVSVMALCAVGCNKDDGFTDLDYYDFEDFITLKNFTVKFS